MKNVVIGLFDEGGDARRVLEQLADSPLDLDTVQVVHADPDVQRAMAAEAGLPGDRAVPTGAVIGALLGALVGAYVGADWLTALGPVLTAAAGTLIGGGAGGALGAFSETVRLPEAHADEMAEAIDGGAAAILVRTTNLPTARAISDLFYAGGARSLGPIDAAVPMAFAASGAPLEHAFGDAAALPNTPMPDDEHALFAPPWRRTPFAARPKGGVPVEVPATSTDAVAPGAPSAAARPPDASVDDAPLATLDLPPRITTALEAAGVTTVQALRDALQDGDETLLAIRGIGPKAVTEIRDRLDAEPSIADSVPAPVASDATDPGPEPEAWPDASRTDAPGS